MRLSDRTPHLRTSPPPHLRTSAPPQAPTMRAMSLVELRKTVTTYMPRSSSSCSPPGDSSHGLLRSASVESLQAHTRVATCCTDTCGTHTSPHAVPHVTRMQRTCTCCAHAAHMQRACDAGAHTVYVHMQCTCGYTYSVEYVRRTCSVRATHVQRTTAPPSVPAEHATPDTPPSIPAEHATGDAPPGGADPLRDALR